MEEQPHVTATAEPSTSRSTRLRWIPSPLYRMTVERYKALVASSVFSKTTTRLHLINGYLVAG